MHRENGAHCLESHTSTGKSCIASGLQHLCKKKSSFVPFPMLVLERAQLSRALYCFQLLWPQEEAGIPSGIAGQSQV